MTEDAMTAGAKGVTYGRNIFAHKTPDKMVEALAGIIFKKQTAKKWQRKLATEKLFDCPTKSWKKSIK